MKGKNIIFLKDARKAKYLRGITVPPDNFQGWGDHTF